MPAGRRSPYRLVLPNIARGRMVAPWLIVLALCGVAMQSMLVYVERTRFLGGWHAASNVARVEVGIHRAMHGSGPEENDLESLRRLAPADGASTETSVLPGPSALQVRDGSFNLRVDTHGLSGNLSWRLARADGDATLLWICGYARAPSGFTPPALANLTDVPPLWLPSACRNLP